MGGLIPFLGFKTELVDEDGLPISEPTNSPYIADLFVIEWLNVGFVIFAKNIRPL